VWEGESKSPLTDLKKQKAAIRKEFEEKKLRFEKERPSFSNAVRNAPGADFFAPTLKVQQVILPDLKDQLNFTKVDKVDRCHTCHVGIQNPTYDVVVRPEAEDEEARYAFKNEFLRAFVDHARGRGAASSCGICRKENRPEEIPEPLAAHGAWTSQDAIRFVKVFRSHPRLDLYVTSSSKHPLEKFGCTICHEGDGRDTDFTRTVHTPDTPEEATAWRNRHGTPFGEERYDWNYRELWDLPMFPSKFAQSSCRRCHAQEVDLDGADKYVQGMTVFERAGCYGCHRTDSYQILPKDVGDPGLDPNRRARRPGPPLTRIASKVTEEWAWKWIFAPREFRPTTRMPHFFKQSNARHEVNKNPHRPEEIEGTIVTSIVKYLWSLSEKAPDPAPPELAGDGKRGELLVRQVGCMACHRVEEATYDGESRFLKEFAPTLAGVGGKMNRTWLYHWVRDPKRHFPDSAMPSLRLSEQEAVDVVEYLMSLRLPEWEQKPGPPAVDPKLLDDLIIEQLRLKLPEVDAKRRVQEMNRDPDAKLLWFGRRMVKNFGCYSCHELRPESREDLDRIKSPSEVAFKWPDEEGIGVELTGSQPFGSKHHDRLDYGYAVDDGVNHKGVTFKHGFTDAEVTAKVHETRQDWLAWKLRNPRIFDGGKMAAKPHDELLRMPDFGFSEYEIDLVSTFVLSFTDHAVAGLVGGAQKLLDPDELGINRGNRVARDNNCRACHRFSLDRFQVEWTRLDPEKKKDATTWVEVEGRNLGKASPEDAEGILKEWGLRGDLYSIAWSSDHCTLASSPAINRANQFVGFDGVDWWYLDADAEGKPVRRPIRRRVEMDGGEVLPQIEEFKQKLNRDYVGAKEKLEDRLAELEDLIKEEKDEAAKAKLQEELSAIERRLAAEFALDRILDASDPGQLEARYPPMLRTQGVKTQSEWLFGFLKEPKPIRPNIFPLAPGAKTLPDLNIRMPTFGLTDEEAAALVRFFALRDQLKDPAPYPNPAFAEVKATDVYPHTSFPERDASFLERRKEIHARVLSGVVREREKGCASCHYVNGEAPPGDPFKHAPDLALVEARIRPRWLYPWITEPAAIYPRTTMTAFWTNLSDPQQQDEIRAAVEILLNFSRLNPKSQ
jgi:mono/diheme cytochrome c family protein